MNQKSDETIRKILNGRKKGLIVIYTLVGFSILSIIITFLSNSNGLMNFVPKRLFRLIIEIELFYALMNGKSWAKSILNIEVI